MSTGEQGEQIVFVVDDDPSIRTAISVLLDTKGVTCRTFGSARGFLDAYAPEMEGCLILDLHLPDIDGLELQRLLKEKRINLPIVFVSGSGSISPAVQAIKGGAQNFLQKPFGEHELLDSIRQALVQGQRRRQTMAHLRELRERSNTLSPREAEVMRFMVDGDSSKVIARKLGISPRTVEIHRSKVMQKMECNTLAQLVQIVMELYRDDLN